ncbi:hypothetical protein ACFXGT_11650 [Streptomyces sp. NPDC059352]|uniref:hypothetical protein n=1 Tax=Streptomyces sp. NPDC059352 TaxID=3346810 RepID=UPI0036A0029C
MPFMVLTSEYISLDGIDLSEYTRKGELGIEVEEKEVTNYASAGWKVVIGGLKSGELGVEFLQDFANTRIDSIMWPKLGLVVPFEVRPTNAAVGTSNPKYTGSVLIKEWKPIEGGVGDEATSSASFPTSGPVLRATA